MDDDYFETNYRNEFDLYILTQMEVKNNKMLFNSRLSYLTAYVYFLHIKLVVITFIVANAIFFF